MKKIERWLLNIGLAFIMGFLGIKTFSWDDKTTAMIFFLITIILLVQAVIFAIKDKK